MVNVSPMWCIHMLLYKQQTIRTGSITEMNKSELKHRLAERISPQEEAMLRSSDPELYISDFNREVCLRIIDEQVSDDDTEIDESDVSKLEHSLDSFLCKYMDDHRDAHKWIVLACLELTFVERRPMHPQKKAGWKDIDGHFYCPSMEKDSIVCTYCACEEIPAGVAGDPKEESDYEQI